MVAVLVTLTGSLIAAKLRYPGRPTVKLRETECKKSALNLVNLTHAHGTVVVEAVCDHAPAKGEAMNACEGFVSEIKAPAVGEHVRVIGAYVTDRDNGWNEVHPVTRIEAVK